MAEGEVTITVRPNGPFRVEGPIKLVDTDGKVMDLAWQTRRLPLSLRSIDQQTILRRNPLQNRLPGRGGRGAGVCRKSLKSSQSCAPDALNKSFQDVSANPIPLALLSRGSRGIPTAPGSRAWKVTPRSQAGASAFSTAAAAATNPPCCGQNRPGCHPIAAGSHATHRRQ